MASAASLNATASIVNGQGLTLNPNLSSNISTFQNINTIKFIANIFTSAGTESNIANVIIPILSTLGNSTVSRGQWLIDVYPSNVTAVATPGVVYYGNGLPSFSKTILAQANYPFSAGSLGTQASLIGFAGMWTTAYGYVNQVFDTVSSVNMLQNKTYGQSGLGYTGPVDLVTAGVGTKAPLIGNVVSGWGTMYDINNINLMADPYVFGQNLLDHGLGSYGNLADQLTAVGLDVTDITKVPKSSTITIQQESTSSTSSFVGAVDLPSVVDVTVNSIVTGNNPATVQRIYAGITGANLAAIVSSTGFTSTNANLITLNDYLDLSKVVTSSLYSQLNAQNIYTFTDFSIFLQNKVNQMGFQTWLDLSTFLNGLEIPTLSYTTANANTTVISSTTVSTLNSVTGTGSGPFGNPVMLDYFGAVSGTPYTSALQVINSNYSVLNSGVQAAVASLYTAVIRTNTDFAGQDSANVNPGMVARNVSTVNSAINSAVATAIAGANASKYYNCETAYYIILNKMSSEVTAITKVSAAINSSYTAQFLLGFGQGIGSYGKTDTMGSGNVIANLITNDQYGDTIRSALAETTNSTIIDGRNDPNPRMAIYQAQAQNISLSTYISQNQ